MGRVGRRWSVVLRTCLLEKDPWHLRQLNWPSALGPLSFMRDWPPIPAGMPYLRGGPCCSHTRDKTPGQDRSQAWPWHGM